jgi:hypothetical protein
MHSWLVELDKQSWTHCSITRSDLQLDGEAEARMMTGRFVLESTQNDNSDYEH